jgi:hypothetical protein
MERKCDKNLKSQIKGYPGNSGSSFLRIKILI